MMKIGKDRRVAENTLPDGKWVSTVLLPGSWCKYQTVVFPSDDDWVELDTAVYYTKAEAESGHDEMVRKWLAKADSEARRAGFANAAEATAEGDELLAALDRTDGGTR